MELVLGRKGPSVLCARLEGKHSARPPVLAVLSTLTLTVRWVHGKL